MYGLSSLLGNIKENYANMFALNGDIRDPFINEDFSFKDLKDTFKFNRNLIINEFISFNLKIAKFNQS